MKRSAIYLLIIIHITTLSSAGQERPADKGFAAITQNVIMAQLGFLASDWTEGREAGERGEYLAADYIASMLELYGIKPGGDIFNPDSGTGDTESSGRSYFQKITLLKMTPGEDPVFISRTADDGYTRSIQYSNNIDFSVKPFLRSVEIEAPVLFAGHGIKSAKTGYNDLIKSDVKGKFVMIISGNPGFLVNKMTHGDITSSKKDFEEMLKKKGAAGIIEVDAVAGTALAMNDIRAFPNISPSETLRRSAPRSYYSLPDRPVSDDLPRIRVTSRTANEVLKASGIVVADYLQKAATDYPVDVPGTNGTKIFLKTSVSTTSIPVRNIIGKVEGKNPDEIIVVGAHYDHMGIAGGYVWNGADDNASGTVGVMTLARALMATGEKPEKTVVFAFWTAEEKGLLGSRYYVENLQFPRDNLKLNINFDMISRYISDDEPKKVTMTYNDTYPVFRDLTETNLKKYNIDLDIEYQPLKDPSGGSDHRSFVEAGIPVLRFKPGHRGEYHTPYDEINTVNTDIMEKIIRISFADLLDLANSKW